jgi:hypothetical protein
MAAELQAPIDRITGLPYPIAPGCRELPEDKPEDADLHHGFFQGRDPLLKDTLAGIALRNCAIQLIERPVHVAVHQWYGETAGLPTEEDDAFSRTLAAVAGVIPDMVSDFSTGEPVVRPATSKEQAFLRTPSPEDVFGYKYMRYNYSPILEFYADFVSRRDLSHVPQARIEEFLTTANMERKRMLGARLLSNAAAVASDPIREQYYSLRRDSLLHPRMPQEPQTLIRYKLGHTPERLGRFIPLLEKQLLATVS